jgi:hypothetical protein
MMRPRTKTLAICCPACKLWVRPRRYDPRLHRCWDCVLLTLDRTPLALSVRHVPRLVGKGA